MKKKKLLVCVLCAGIFFSQGTKLHAAQVKPIANFIFDQENYIVGQQINVTNVSKAQGGKQLVQSMWMVNVNPNTKTDSLKKVFSMPSSEGTYLISLKVKDSKGTWSEWTTKKVSVLPNKSPIVTAVSADKEVYKRGEQINFTYTYENEEWEPIAEEQWTYRAEGESVGVANPIKPNRLFDVGKYIVTLTLKDTNGNLSNQFEFYLEVNQGFDTHELRYNFETAWPGTIIDNMKGFNFQDYKEVAPELTLQQEGKLIMSNSPEQLIKEGILYQDTVSGEGRMIMHHVNNFSDESNEANNKKFIVIAQNKTAERVTLKISQKSIKGPLYDILNAGQEVLELYLMHSPEVIEYTLDPGEKIYLYNSAPRIWSKGRVISGLFNFEAAGDVTFTTAVSNEKRSLEEILAMPVIKRDPIHNRGTFNTISRTYVINLKDYNEPTKLLIGNKGKEEWITGVDATSGEEIYNMGNYGLSHYIKVTAKEDTGVLLNPRGGIYRGAIGWDNGHVIIIPRYGAFTKPVRAATLGVVEEDDFRIFEYILSNGSAAPLLFGFVPEDYWDKPIGYKITK